MSRPEWALAKCAFTLATPIRSSQPLVRAQCRALHQRVRRPSTRIPRLAHSTPRRNASTAAALPANRLRNFISGSALILTVTFGYLYITDTRAGVHQWLVIPALRLIHADPEEAHHAGIRYIKALYDFGFHPRERGRQDEHRGDLRVEVFGHVLDNPLGTSAGMDKNAEIPSALLALGPAIVEVGGATPHPQQGNAQPRVFRLPSQNALINRYGLNSEGAEYVAMQLRERVRAFAYANGLGLEPESERIVLDGEAEVPPGSLVPGRLLAVQIAKNKTTPDSDIKAVAADYVYCVEHLAKYADILVVNVSSPNTPGLRDLQASAPLTAILTAVVDAAQACTRKTKPAVMVKVSPDEGSEEQIDGICSAVWASGVDGVIVGNTTKKRPDSFPKGYVLPKGEQRLLDEAGGYSGPQMFERTLNLVKRYRNKLDHEPADEPDSPPIQKEQDASTSSTSTGRAIDLSPNIDDPSTQRDLERLKPLSDEAEKQPLIQIPERHSSDSSSVSVEDATPLEKTITSTNSKVPKSTDTNSKRNAAGAADNTNTPTSGHSTPSTDNTTLPEPKNRSTDVSSAYKNPSEPKVIFASGGITNGEQCLQILNAGASVCQVYTAMMYGGVGTLTRMKEEMRESMSKSKGQGGKP